MAADQIRGWEFQDGAKDWRVLSTAGVGAWFGAASHRDGVALLRRIIELRADDQVAGSLQPNVDIRGVGVQVRIPIPSSGRWTTADLALAQGISAAARALALTADPSVLQDMEWGIDTEDRARLAPFWQTLLGYEDTEHDDLLDPLRRDPRVWFYPATPRPLRDRVHLDVSVPAEVAEQRVAAARNLGGKGDWAPTDGRLLLTDAEGNEVDYVPARGLDEGPETADWWLPFGGMVFYPTTDFEQSVDLADGVARVADDVGLSLMIDLRSAGVMIDTGKDRWEDDRFPVAARRVQHLARSLGLTADPTRLRFVQVCIDAVDVSSVREFWRAVLGYRSDPREYVTDIYDPRRLNRPMIFQAMDPSDTARREQRNRIHLDLYVPDDQVAARRQAALAAGGHYTRGDGGTIADPEGNEVDIGKAIADPPPTP
ncbi:VOC family protein [Microlunatus soli]|uniref:Glyoxalase-like domain-containing protein n=1 Tax=Microlunatus soli TaxID=630515 RepID=A0A1H2ADQ7_9ACTN|nr:VOC family protein [Microlunatus soli]SDT44044.1 hypothetical protein SAMN04489812_5853 [Microlunatus soli]